MPGIYRSIYAKEGQKEPSFYPPKLGDPPPSTSNVTTPLYLPLLLQSPSLRSTQRWPIDGRPVVLEYCALHQTGRGWLPAVPCVRFYIVEGGVLWYGLGRPVITSEIGNWSVFVLLGWRFVFGIIIKRDGREPRIIRCHHDSGSNKAASLLRLLRSKVSNYHGLAK